ncbi:MAG TPA: formate dehydrogenase subunit gamma [Burkholderiales bacterium]|nr:formate dehydrogenase subunit gamma [Burkholderiales bacterium]
MKRFSRSLRLSLLLVAVSAAGAARAQYEVPMPGDPDVQAQQKREESQPGNNAPVWRDARSGQTGFTSLPGREMGVLIQSGGETWRQIRNGPVMFYGGWLVLLTLIAILAFYFWKGPVRVHAPPTGRLIHRFNAVERVVHWSTALSFCLLGVTGLIMFFGKHVLLPWLGYTLFAWLATAAKAFHNFIAPLFIVSVLAMIVLFIKDNFPRLYDLRWFARAWAVMARGEHVPTGRFNAGEKGWFWFGVVGLSIVVSWSGLLLLFPNFDQTRAVMQQAWIWHATAALLYIAIALGHIYLGTIGLEGSYQAMRTGYVDETWAKEHHEYWYNEVKSRKGAAPGGAVPAGAPHMKEKS